MVNRHEDYDGSVEKNARNDSLTTAKKKRGKLIRIFRGTGSDKKKKNAARNIALRKT